MFRKFLLQLKPVRLFIPVLVLCLTACTLITPPTNFAPSGAPIKLKAVVLPYISSGPLFIAQEEGFFTDQGLEVEFVRMDTGAGPLPALETGEVDVAASGPTAGLLNALARGGTIRIVADKGNLDPAGCTYMALLAQPAWIATDPLADPTALTDLRVSIDPTNFEAFMLDGLLSNYGQTLDNLQVQDIAPPALADAAQNKAVDLISVGEPWVTRLLDTGNVALWQSGQEVAPDLQFGLILFGKHLLDGDPAVGVRFLTAYLQGVRQYNAGQTDRNIEIMANYTNLDPDLLRRACWPAMRADGHVNLDSILAFQEWAVEKGLVDQPASAGQLWNEDLVVQASQQVETTKP